MGFWRPCHNLDQIGRETVTMKYPALICAALLLSTTAQAREAQRYRDCVDEALNNPVETFVVANSWRDEGGGVPAEHCLALVLAALERYEPAARQLELVAKHLKSGAGVNPFTMNNTPELQASLHAQAGNAWLLAGRGGEAYDAFSNALRESGANADGSDEILIDRARASMLLEKPDAAIRDLDQAQLMAAKNPLIYLFRAAARRKLEDLPAAKADIDTALKLDPKSPDIRLEAGNIASAQGEMDDARRYWLDTTRLSEEGPAVEAARTNLANLDINQE